MDSDDLVSVIAGDTPLAQWTMTYHDICSEWRAEQVDKMDLNHSCDVVVLDRLIPPKDEARA